MYILFSGSEGKNNGGIKKEMSFEFGKSTVRAPLLREYEAILKAGGVEAGKLTGWKNAEKITQLPVNLRQASVTRAIDRFAGVGFQYLDYTTCTKSAQEYLQNHLIIFSHLFGPLGTEDLIPETKLKQCSVFADKRLAQYYNENTEKAIDKKIKQTIVLDLRAEIYRSYYEPTGEVIRAVFLKNGKVMNHWSKAYRGVLAREVAIKKPKTRAELAALKIPEMTLINEETTPSGAVLTYDIIG